MALFFSDTTQIGLQTDTIHWTPYRLIDFKVLISLRFSDIWGCTVHMRARQGLPIKWRLRLWRGYLKCFFLLIWFSFTAWDHYMAWANLGQVSALKPVALCLTLDVSKVCGSLEKFSIRFTWLQNLPKWLPVLFYLNDVYQSQSSFAPVCSKDIALEDLLVLFRYNFANCSSHIVTFGIRTEAPEL